MKNTTIVPILILLSTVSLKAQSYNWARYDQEKIHHLSAEFSVDYGITVTLRYSRYSHFFLPVMFQTDITVPAGTDLMDDFRYRLGWQATFLEVSGFHLSGKINAVARRYESIYTRQHGFGGEYGISAGYYRHRWYVAAETGYGHTDITHIRHTTSYLDIYPGAKDGWYGDLAGNFFYGLQAGISFKTLDLTLRAGMTRNRWFESNTIPMYAGIGINYRFQKDHE